MSTARVRKGGRVDPATLPRGPNGRALCRFCQTVECAPPRKTFCSNACVIEHKVRTRPAFAKMMVFRRDAGVCAICHTDTKELARELWEEGLRFGRTHQQRLLGLHGIPRNRKVYCRKYGGNLWDLEHTLPVWKGGGEAGLNALATMCVPCHREKTKREAAERAAIRRVSTL